MNYLPRLIDRHLKNWAISPSHKPVLLRGARQVGKSWAVRHLGESFTHFVEINFERNPEYKTLFLSNLDIHRIISQLSALTGKEIVDGQTLLFLDEIQECPEAIMSLRFFKEERPQLHVVAAGSLLEFALEALPTFGVGRIHSMFMYPMTFDEFVTAHSYDALLDARNNANVENPLPDILHDKLVELFRTYILVGGMPEVVANWVATKNFLQCRQLLNDLLTGYEDDFAKYRKKISPEILRATLRSCASQLTEKFSYASVGNQYKTYEIKQALELLAQAGLITIVRRTDANGLPLGAESDEKIFKVLTLDPGLTLRILSFDRDREDETVKNVLTQTGSELVNKGPMAELIAGLEIVRYQTPDLRHELFYWTRKEKNSLAEVDYVIGVDRKVMPVEVKANTQGGMKSLWSFMKLKKLNLAVRSSLENFGEIKRLDTEEELKVIICPLYALSQLPGLVYSAAL